MSGAGTPLACHRCGSVLLRVLVQAANLYGQARFGCESCHLAWWGHVDRATIEAWWQQDEAESRQDILVGAVVRLGLGL